MTFPIIQKLDNQEFYDHVAWLHERLTAKCAHNEDIVRSNVDKLNEKSFSNLLSEDMHELWVYLLTKGASNSLIDMLETAYPLRGQWWLYKSSNLSDKQLYQDRQKTYQKLKANLFEFLSKHIYEDYYAELQAAFEDTDYFFEQNPLNTNSPYNTIPRKSNSDTAEDVFLQRELVQAMYVYYKQPNYKYVAMIVDVLMENQNETTPDKIMHNTKDISDFFSGRSKK